MTVYSLYGPGSREQRSGNPMMLVTGVGTLLVSIAVKIMNKVGKSKYYIAFDLLALVYMIIHACGAVCTYKEWVPESFRRYPKDVMQWQIMINFILVNSIPLMDFLNTLFFMLPVFLISSYLQLQEETKDKQF